MEVRVVVCEPGSYTFFLERWNGRLELPRVEIESSSTHCEKRQRVIGEVHAQTGLEIEIGRWLGKLINNVHKGASSSAGGPHARRCSMIALGLQPHELAEAARYV